MSRRYLLLGLAVAVVLVGCGSGSSDPEPAPSETSYEREAVNEAAEPPKLEENFQIVAGTEEEDGSTADLKLRLGDLVSADEYTGPRGFAGLADECEIDYGRDVVIPGEFTATNTTSRFPIDIGSGFTIERPFGVGGAAYDGEDPYARIGPKFSVAQRFSDHDECQNVSEDEATHDAEVDFNLEEGQRGRQQFVVVVHDYYSPEHPNGDEASLSDLRIKIFDPRLYTNGWELTCLSSSGPLDGHTARLDGKLITNPAFDYESSDVPAC